MADKFEMVDVDFGAAVLEEMSEYVEQQLTNLIESHRDLHMNKLVKWRNLYKGKPAEETRNFPFPNAANTIVQVIGETVDTMVARVMGLIYATHPLWVFKNYARSEDPKEQKVGEERRRSIEDFMDLVGFEPKLLDLQRIEAQWFTDAAKLGTSFVKLAVEQNQETIVVGYGEDSRTKIKARMSPIYSGPKVYKLRNEDVLASPDAQTLEEAEFVAVRRTLRRKALEERGFIGAYKTELVDKVMDSPDRSTFAEPVRAELQAQGVAPIARPDTTAEWDIYECYFAWWAGKPKRKFRVIFSYHKKTKTVLRKVFNFLPNNALPVKRAKLGYRTDGLYGHGYAELLESYQEELSTTHNQRLDNGTVANIRALRVSPRARALDANMELFPSAILVGEKDEIEPLQVGDVYPSTFKEEEMTLGLVARRAGITPAISGSGTGGMMKKPAGVYSAQGTLAVMQENNSVVGFATSEFRHAHVMLGSELVAMYGKFGTGSLEEAFGIDGEKLIEALELFEKNVLAIPIRSATGSLNKEVDKQTGMIMAGVLQRHYTATAQVLQALASPMIPPEARDYFAKTIMASEMLHRRVVKDFGYEQPELYVPEANAGGGAGPQAPQGGAQGGQQPPGGQPMAGAGVPLPSRGSSLLPDRDMAQILSGVGAPQR